MDTEILEFAQGDTFLFEEEDPKSGFIALLSVVMLIVVVGSIVGLTGYWNWYYNATTDDQNTNVGTQLKDLREKEEKQLAAWGYADQAKGLVRVPIEQAMKLIAQESAAGKYREGVQITMPASATTPAAGATAPAVAAPATAAPVAPATKAAAATAAPAPAKPAAPAHH